MSQQLPIITGSTTSQYASTTKFFLVCASTISYKDIGIDVKVTPLMRDDGSVGLEINQKVDDVVSNVTIDNNSQPRFVATEKPLHSSMSPTGR